MSWPEAIVGCTSLVSLTVVAVFLIAAKVVRD
jgi:hypothetical protein